MDTTIIRRAMMGDSRAAVKLNSDVNGVISDLCDNVDQLRESVEELLAAMRQYEIDVEGPAPPEHRRMIERAEALTKGGG